MFLFLELEEVTVYFNMHRLEVVNNLQSRLSPIHNELFTLNYFYGDETTPRENSTVVLTRICF